MTICFCCSTSALKVWKNSSCVEVLAGDELHVVDHQHVDRAEHLLEALHVLDAQRRDEAVHELLGGEVDDAGVGVGLPHLPGDRLHEVGLAEADAAVEEQRVEGDRAALGHALGDAARGGVGELVRLADDEVVEGAAPVDRRGRQVVTGRRRRAAAPGAGGGGARRGARSRGPGRSARRRTRGG